MRPSKKPQLGRRFDLGDGNACAAEPLEARLLLSATVLKQIPAVAAETGSFATTVNLGTYFDDPSITGTAVLMQTSEGNIPIALDDSTVAATVQNFLSYVNSGAYNNTFIHRVATFNADGIGIVQGGGYDVNGDAIATSPPIALQYNLPNVAGTIAMARTSDENSATSEWFFNTTDNSQTLGSANGGGYAVFGTVLYNGMTAVDAIYNLPLGSYNTTDGAQTAVPLQNYSSGTPSQSNLVVIQSAAVVSPLSYTVTSTNSSLVDPTISNGVLALSYATNQVGTASVTVTATDLGGNSVSNTFQVQVGSIIGPGGAKQVRYTDADGTAATISLAGPGTANVQFSGSNITQSLSRSKILTVSGSGLSISTIDLSGTTAASSLNVTGHGGDGLVELADISDSGALRAINAPQGDLTGAINLGGTLNTLTLARASGGTITVSGTSGTLAAKIASADGETITFSQAARIQATAWGSSTPDTLAAPSVSQLTVRGVLDANLDTAALGPVTAGSITGGTWSLSGAVKTITAGSIANLALSAAAVGRINSRGAVSASSFTTTGNITAFAAASLSDSQVNAGSAGQALPDSASQFINSATISSVTIRGVFSNSDIAAAMLGRLNLKSIASQNNGVPFGAAAEQIVALTAVVDGKKLSLKKITTADQVASALTAAAIAPNDLAIRIVS